MYLKDCGECEVKKPGAEAALAIDGGGNNDGGVGYLGPWDEGIYR